MSLNEMLYNKYRPTKLSEVVGQKLIIKDLQKRSKDNSLPRVILLSGPTGLGKTTLERIISKNLACNNKDVEGNSCNTCDICETITQQKKNTFYFSENCSNLGINEVRELVENMSVKSFSKSKIKIFSLDELQEMRKTPAALNNLLKPLESDSPYTYFILGTMSEKDVPKAILNRCTHYRLKPHSLTDIANQLQYICKQENIDINTEEKADVLVTIADNSYGSLRTAISYLERVINSELWTVAEVVSELDIISNVDLVSNINKLFNGDPSALNITYSTELVDKLRYMFGTMYKIQSGVEVPRWQADQLNGISKTITLQQIDSALQKLFMLNQYPYVSQNLIDYILIQILNDNKQIASTDQPVRRRVNNCKSF